MRLKKMALYLAASLAALSLVFHFVYRPWQLTWGATDEEVARRMVGDDIVTNPTFDATRAVTIQATPEEIWPWIIQIGYKKAGFYSWDRLDNAGIPSAERIIPEYQDLKVGDRIPLSRAEYARVTALEPNRHMLLVFEWEESATWAWGIYQTGPRQSRLVTRLRVRVESAMARLSLDAFELIMMRKCLLGIKRRSESVARPSGLGAAANMGQPVVK
ncbi:MAG: hypothetical protein V3V49_05845 [Candidatus Krumholzibacteria bacterium]